MTKKSETPVTEQGLVRGKVIEAEVTEDGEKFRYRVITLPGGRTITSSFFTVKRTVTDDGRVVTKVSRQKD